MKRAIQNMIVMKFQGRFVRQLCDGHGMPGSVCFYN